MRVFVTGGTGQIGSRLVPLLLRRKDEVVLLTRRYAEARQKFGTETKLVEGDPMKAGDWMDAVADCDGVINLAGENLFNRRWNDSFKTLMRDSRLKSTENVVQALAKNPKATHGGPKVLVNASAIGYYGPHGDEELDENSPPGSDFLAGLCVEWEKAAQKARDHGVRVALVRIGVVLDRLGGALAQLWTPFKFGIGGKVGSGKQWMSWIHHEDMAGVLIHALDNGEANGPINGTAPNPVTNYTFTKALGRALGRPTIFPVPGFVLKLRFGEVAAVVVTGQRVLPRAALALGYQFKFPTIDEALTNIVKNA